mgnify:CR=1 FL=1
MNITKEMMDAKLKQIAEFEAKWGECGRSRAIKNYCTNEKFRSNVNEFTRTAKNLIVGHEKYKK